MVTSISVQKIYLHFPVFSDHVSQNNKLNYEAANNEILHEYDSFLNDPIRLSLSSEELHTR